MLYNGCIQSTVQLEIYRRCCQMVTRNLKGSLFHPGLMFSLILFNTNSWSMALKGRLLEKDKIEGIYMNLIDLVNKQVFGGLESLIQHLMILSFSETGRIFAKMTSKKE